MSHLYVTDGTTRVNLYSLTGGAKTQSVRAPIAQPKGDGTWAESALEDGRQLLDYHWGNIVEAYTVDLTGGNQDATLALLRLLNSLFVKAQKYWRDGWRTGSVWLERKAHFASNIEYAVIYQAKIPGAPEIFDEPFLSNAVMASLEITIEHTDWRQHPPGSTTAYKLAGYMDWGGKNYGNVNAAGTIVPTTAQEVYLANCYKESQITHIYWFDASAAPPNDWSGNLQGTAPPFAFFAPAAVGAGDITYFGIDSTVGDSGPFFSLVFDIVPGSTFAGGHQIYWEQWTGAAWAIVYIVDTSSSIHCNNAGWLDSFLYSGVHSVHWLQNATACNTGNLQTIFGGGAPNVTGYWVRARVANVGGGGGPPQQGNRDIYTINWPFAEILADQVKGDERANTKLTMVNSSGWDENMSPHNGIQVGRYIMGLRSYDRGPDFSAFLPIADEQRPPNVACTAHVGAFQDRYDAPSGRCLVWSPGAVAVVDVASLVITSPSADDYLGAFHCFLRAMRAFGGGTDVYWRLQAKVGGRGIVFAETDWERLSTTNSTAVDWHTFIIPGQLPADQVNRLTLTVQADVRVAAGTYYIYDLILMPVDEWAGDVLSPHSDVNLGAIYLEIDSVTHPKQYIIANAVDTVTTPDELTARYRCLNNGPAQFTPGTRQRLWVFQIETLDSGSTHAEYPTLELASTISAVGRGSYLTPRGSS